MQSEKKRLSKHQKKKKGQAQKVTNIYDSDQKMIKKIEKANEIDEQSDILEFSGVSNNF